jgi:hypothetical protein
LFLAWIVSPRDEEEPECAPFEHDEIDHLVHIPGNDGYMRRASIDNRGDLLRGRQRDKDPSPSGISASSVQDLIANQTVLGIPLTLIGNTLDGMIWAGPMVIVMREGSTVMQRYHVGGIQRRGWLHREVVTKAKSAIEVCRPTLYWEARSIRKPSFVQKVSRRASGEGLF